MSERSLLLSPRQSYLRASQAGRSGRKSSPIQAQCQGPATVLGRMDPQGGQPEPSSLLVFVRDSNLPQQSVENPSQ